MALALCGLATESFRPHLVILDYMLPDINGNVASGDRTVLNLTSPGFTGEVRTDPAGGTGNFNFQVSGGGLRFQLDLGTKQNVGLFLDMRYGRRWVRERAHGKRVLNLFAYTCGFSVAALAGGAEQVVNLDMAKAALNRGRDNHRLNGHDLNRVIFLGHELFKSWGNVRRLGPYDLVIIDPPSFQKGSFVLTQDYRKILRRLPELLNAGGSVLACLNDPALGPEFLLRSMAEEAPGLRFEQRLDNPPEFADIDADSGLKALVFRHSDDRDDAPQP